MIDKAFQFDLSSWKWVECNSKYVIPDISELPLHVIYQFWDSKNAKYRYCLWNDYSRCMLEVAEIKSPDLLIDSAGNEYYGLFTVAYNYEDLSTMNTMGAFGVEEAHFRWRVFQRKAGMPLLLALDCATVPKKTKKYGYRQKKRTIIYQYSFLTAQRKYMAYDLQTYVPDEVYLTALKALQEDIAFVSGNHPAITPWIQNTHLVSSLQALIEQPYAPNAFILRPFIGQRYNELFSQRAQDDFTILAKQFAIEPSDELREAYANNPYAIVIYLLMRQMGFSWQHITAAFFDFTDSFFGIKLHKFRYDWEKKWVEIEPKKNYYRSGAPQKSRVLDNIQFFVNWLLENKNTADVQKYLLNGLIWCNQPSKLHDFLEMFREYFPHIEQRNKERLLQEGLMLKAIDACEYSIAKMRINATIARNGRAMTHLEVQVNDHNFRVVSNEHWLPYICQQLHYRALTDYQAERFPYDIVLVSVDKGGKFVACIELCPTYRGHGTYSIKSIHGDYYLRPSKEILDATIYWAKLHRLDIESNTLQNTECIWYDDTKFHRRDCPPRKIYSSYTLDILQKMTNPNDEDANAYYHALALRLNESPIPHLAMPTFLVPKNEMEYLRYVFPQGQRIFRGAVDGIAQAQYELATFYQNGRFFPPDQKRMLYWYNQAAQNGLAEAMWQMAMLSLLDKDLTQAEKWLTQLSQHTGMFGYMAKAVSYLLAENTLSIGNIIGCMSDFQTRG